jgi:hypothetical protein
LHEGDKNSAARATQARRQMLTLPPTARVRVLVTRPWEEWAIAGAATEVVAQSG